MQAVCDRRSNTARRARPLQTGLRPEPHATAPRGPRASHSLAAGRALSRALALFSRRRPVAETRPRRRRRPARPFANTLH